MRLFLIILLTITRITISFSLTVDDFQSHATGNWNAKASWERWDGSNWITPAPSFPSLTSNVTIQAGHNITVNTPATVATITLHGQLTGSGANINPIITSGSFISDGTLSFGTAASAAITIGGNLTINLGTFTIGGYNFSVSGITTISGNANFTDAIAAGVNTFTGNVILQSSASFTSTVVVASTNMWFNGGLSQNSTGTVALGSATINGDLNIYQGTVSVSTGNFSVSGVTNLSGGNFLDNNAAGIDTFTGQVTITNSSTFTSTLVIAGTNMLFNGGFTYNSSGASSLGCMATDTIIISNGSVTIAGGPVTAASFTISGGSLTISTGAFTISGATNISGGSFTDNSNTGIDTFTGLVTVSGTGGFTSTAVVAANEMLFNSGLTHTSSGTTALGTAVITGDLNISLGTVSVSTGNFSVSGVTNIPSGNFTDNSNTGTDTFTGLVTVSGTGSFTSTIVLTANEMLFNSGLTHTSTGTTALGTAAITGDLNITQGTVSVLSGNFSVSGVTNISGGTFLDNNAAGIDTFTGQVTVSNTGTFVSTLVIAAADMLFNGGFTHSSSGSSSLGCAATDTMIISNGAVTIAAGPVTAASLTLSGGSLTISTGAFTISGTTNISGGVFLDNSNTGKNTFSGLVTVSGTGVLNSTIVTTNTNMNFNGGLTQSSSDSTVLSGAIITNLSISNGYVSVSSTGNITVSGTTNISGGYFIDNSNTGTDTFSGLVTLSGSGAWTSTLVTTAGRMVFQGGITQNGSGAVQIGTATFNTNASSLTMTATSTGNVSFANAVAVNIGFTITGSGSGSLIFSNNVAIAANMTLTNQRYTSILGVLSGAATSTYVNDISSTLAYASATAPMVAGTFTCTAIPNKVIYNGNVNQAVKGGISYYNLTINNTGISPANVCTMSAATTVLDSLNIINGTFSVGNLALTLNGTYTNTGTLNCSTGAASKIVLSGSSAQTFAVGNYVNNYLSVLQINNPNNVTLGANLTVNTTLTLTIGFLYLGAYNLTYIPVAAVGGAPSVSSMVVTNGSGQFIKNFTGVAATFTFPIGDTSGTPDYTPVTLTFTLTTAGNLGVRVTDATQPDNIFSTDYITRYWSITTTMPNYTYTAAFTYTVADVVGTEANLKLNRWDPGAINWICNSTSTVNTLTHVLTSVAGLTQTSFPVNNMDFTGRDCTVNVYFRSKNSGIWNVTGMNRTWEVSSDPAFTSPLPVDAVFPPDDLNSAGITILNGHTITLNSNISSDQFTVNSGGQLIINSGVTLSVSDGTGTDLTNNGTVNINGVLSNAGQISNTGTFNINSGGKYQHAQNGGAIPAATSWDPNSTCEITGISSIVPTGLIQAFGSFTWNCPTQSSNINFAGNLATLTGNFNIASTGTSELQLTNTAVLTLTLSGNLNISGGILNFASGTAPTGIFNIGGNYNQTGGTFKNSDATSSLSINFTGTNKTFIQTGTLTNANMNWQIIDGASLTLNNTLPVAAGQTLTVGKGSSGTLYCDSNFVTGAGGFILSSNATLGIGSPAGINSAFAGGTGNIQVTNSRTYNSGANYIYNGAVAQSTGDFTTTTAYTVQNLTINNSSGVTLTPASLTISNQLSLSSGVFNNSGKTLIFGNNATIIRTTGSIAAVPSFGTSVNVTYLASDTSGYEIPASTTVLNNLTINDPGGVVTLDSNAFVNSVLNLNSAWIVSSSTAMLIMNAGSSISGTPSNNSFVKGPVKKVGSTAFLFPVGADSGSVHVYAPLQISAPGSANDTFTVEYHTGKPPYPFWNTTANLYTSNLDHAGDREWWQLTRGVSSASAPSVTLYWNSGNIDHYITDNSDLRIAHYNPNTSKWENMGGMGSGTVGTGYSAQGSITSTISFHNYSPLDFGSEDGSNPLPIELVNFDLSCGKNAVDITWSTASETDNAYFTIEKSFDLSTWNSAGQLAGAGNSNIMLYYKFEDFSISDETVYYRIRQTDYNGNYKYSENKAITCPFQILPNISVVPNPVDDIVYINFNKSVNFLNFQICNLLGNVIRTVDMTKISGNSVTISLKEFPTGIYFIKIHSPDLSENFKIIKK